MLSPTPLQGGTRRGTVPRARCSSRDGSCAHDSSWWTNATRAQHVHMATAGRRAGYTRCRRAAFYAARLVPPLPERSPTAIPWRERPPEKTAWLATPAAGDVVAHATAERVLAPRASTVSAVE